MEKVFFVSIGLLFYDDFSVIHIHATGVIKLPALLWRQFNRNLLIERQGLANMKIPKHHLFKTAGRIFANKIYFCRFALWNGDNFRRVTAFNGDINRTAYGNFLSFS